MKTFAFLAIIALTGYLALHFSPAGQRAQLRMRQTAASQRTKPEEKPSVGVLVVEFSDMNDLLRKLRTVRTGQDIDIRQVGPGEVAIKCSDTAAKAAYMERVNREAEQLNREVQSEIKRINRMP